MIYTAKIAQTTTEKTVLQRSVFEKFANRMNFDPLIAANWYKFTADSLQDLVGYIYTGLHVLTAHQDIQRITIQFGGLTPALSTIFPEVIFDISKFSRKPSITLHAPRQQCLIYCAVKYWADLQNRRKLFIDFAEAKGFDPLVGENWYNVTTEFRNDKVKRSTYVVYSLFICRLSFLYWCNTTMVTYLERSVIYSQMYSWTNASLVSIVCSRFFFTSVDMCCS